MDVVGVDERSKINEWFACQPDITISPSFQGLAGLELPPEKSPTKNSGRATAKPGDRGDAVLCPARSNPHDDEDEEEDEQQQ
ncbi:hypothetical protein HZH66_005884 [Vespula vulgaris]|uniref:Uncharacterized protein n=1 Tax=Vespula vulgaris TaxID=7454 RepID=A0A834N9E1_VESVU|nr:hypothetical protein HZH66_005884 [Vespula vulgaris]